MIKLQTVTKGLKPLKGFLYGPTFSGKTYSALMIANGIVQSIRKCTEEEAWAHIVMIDTEFGRGSLYASVGNFNYLSIEAPYTTEKLSKDIMELNAIQEVDVIIIDSLTHFWSKNGGILEQKSLADLQGGNSFTNWNMFTAKFNKMIDTILASPKHIIMTARAKSDTVLVANAAGKMAPKTYGLKPELRDGFEFECDFTFNIDKETHNILVDKGIPGMETSYDAATPTLGQIIYKLSSDGAVLKPRTVNDIATSIKTLANTPELIQYLGLQLSGRKLNDLDLQGISKVEKDLISEIKRRQATR